MNSSFQIIKYLHSLVSVADLEAVNCVHCLTLRVFEVLLQSVMKLSHVLQHYDADDDGADGDGVMKPYKVTLPHYHHCCDLIPHNLLIRVVAVHVPNRLI